MSLFNCPCKGKKPNITFPRHLTYKYIIICDNRGNSQWNKMIYKELRIITLVGFLL